jgi:iron complex transport system ATP-binding protein
MSAFSVRNVSVRYAGAQRRAVDDVSIEIAAGQFAAIIGPNGSGKSTLIRALLGALPLEAGQVLFEGMDVTRYSRNELAKRIGAVTQIEEMPFPVSVRELVATGRYPHLGVWRAEREADWQAVSDALARCDVVAMADRSIAEVSGGERQRARIARALAQEPGTLVLDEPTASLDIAHEMSVFELLRSLARDEGRTVIVATHNLNLAARYADIMLLMRDGRAAARGTPAEVMRRDILQLVYGWPVHVFDFDGAPQIAPLSPTRVDI